MNQRGSESCGDTRLAASLVSDLRIVHHQHNIALSLSWGSRYHHKDKRFVVSYLDGGLYRNERSLQNGATDVKVASVLSVLCVVF